MNKSFIFKQIQQGRIPTLICAHGSFFQLRRGCDMVKIQAIRWLDSPDRNAIS